MTFVLDASVAISLSLPDEASDGIDYLLDDLSSTGGLIPSIFWDEFRNVLAGASRRKRITERFALETVQGFRRLPMLTMMPDPAWDGSIMRASWSHRLSGYDATYLVMAQEGDLPLATLDNALARAARAEGVPLVLD